MSENQNIFDTFYFFIIKCENDVQVKENKFVVLWRYSNWTHISELVSPIREILMSKLHFVLVDLLWKICQSSKKIEENCHVSNYDIAKELNIDYKIVLGYLRKVGYRNSMFKCYMI